MDDGGWGMGDGGWWILRTDDDGDGVVGYRAGCLAGCCIAYSVPRCTVVYCTI